MWSFFKPNKNFYNVILQKSIEVIQKVPTSVFNIFNGKQDIRELSSYIIFLLGT